MYISMAVAHDCVDSAEKLPHSCAKPLMYNMPVLSPVLYVPSVPPADVLLQCLGVNWELHRPYLQKSGTLSHLLDGAAEPGPKRYYRNKLSENLDNYITKSQFYSDEYQVSDHLRGCDQGGISKRLMSS